MAALHTQLSGIGLVPIRARPDFVTGGLCVAARSRTGAEETLSSARRPAWPRETKEFVRFIIPQMEWEDLSDEELIIRYRSRTSRSEQYVNELFRRHHAKVARWCLAFTDDRESAADLAQEICAKAYQNLSSFKGQAKFSTWLYSIARNHCLNDIRSHASPLVTESPEMYLDSLPSPLESPDVAMEREQLAAIARHLVCETLEETERTVFTLHFADEIPLDVITRMLNLTNSSGAKAYLVSAKRKLERAVRVWKARA